MKIAFIWDWDPTVDFVVNWKDGLAAALKELQNRGHEVRLMIPDEQFNIINHSYFSIWTGQILELINDFAPDVVLQWGDLTRPHAKLINDLKIPNALCFAGGDAYGPNLGYFDHIFVESKVYENSLQGSASVSIAFGTNTELFKPIDQTKSFDTIFPATFARWKRHKIYAEATEGLRSLAVGLIQEDVESECWQVCLDHNITVLSNVSADALHMLYAASKICVVTSESVGGSQRTVLEAMSMNLPLIVTDSDKFDFINNQHVYISPPKPDHIRQFIDAIITGEQEVNTRDYIVKNWSEYSYADALEKGLQSIL